MADITRQLRRILDTIVQFGGFAGFQLKNASAVMQVRNAADSDFTQAEVKEAWIHGTNATFKVILTAPAGLAADQTVTLPAGGTVPATTGLHVSKIVSFNQATSSPLTVDAAPPANATLNQVRVAVDTAAAGGTPLISIGVSGTTGLYMGTGDNSLKAAGQYINDNFVALGGSPAAIIATIVPSGQTFSGRIELEYILA
jgi:hypothetical protein